MRKSKALNRRYQAWLSAAILLVLFLVSCSETGIPAYKIPVTTNSEKALEYYLEGRALAFALRGDEARQKFALAIEADSSFALAYLEMARNAVSADDLYAYLDKAVALSSGVSEGEKLWIQAVLAYTVQGSPLKARELYQRLVKLYPRDELSHHLLAVHYFLQQDYNKCIDRTEQTLELAPDFSPAYNVLGYSYQFEEDYDQAEKAFQKYVELLPAEPNPYDSYGDLLLKMGRFKDAIDKYEQALLISPGFTMSLRGVAAALNALGRNEEAREKLFAASERLPFNRVIPEAIAISYIEQRIYDSALFALMDLRRLDYEHGDTASAANTTILMGDILLEAGRVEEAEQMYGDAVTAVQSSGVDENIKNSASIKYQYNLGRIAIAKGTLDSADVLAELHLETARERVDPTLKAQAYFLKAMIALRRTQYDRALTHFEQTDRHNPYHLYLKSLALRGQGQAEAADDLLDKARNANLKSSFPLAFVRARLLRKVNRVAGS